MKNRTKQPAGSGPNGSNAGASSPVDGERLRGWLILARIPGVGPRTAARLVEHFGDPLRVLAAGRADLDATGLKSALVDAILDPREAEDKADADLAWAAGEGVRILSRDDPGYPPLLTQIGTPPILLFVRGNPEILKEPMLAIVGSRNPTPPGRETTSDLARILTACGLTIVSGLAIGIDAAAHAGALEVGRTVAVMGTGPDRVYPSDHLDLARRIAKNGALVTEYLPGTQPIGRNFPRRNRIISGLSLGTLITEAASESGSLITARYAVEQGREVFAVPGSIHNPLVKGCHALIREGAKLVESVQDVMDELGPVWEPPAAVRAAEPAGDDAAGDGEDLDPDYRKLIRDMGHDPVAPDELVRRTGLPAQDILSMLLLLELKGHVSSCPGGRYCRNP